MPLVAEWLLLLSSPIATLHLLAPSSLPTSLNQGMRVVSRAHERNAALNTGIAKCHWLAPTDLLDAACGFEGARTTLQLHVRVNFSFLRKGMTQKKTARVFCKEIDVNFPAVIASVFP